MRRRETGDPHNRSRPGPGAPTPPTPVHPLCGFRLHLVAASFTPSHLPPPSPAASFGHLVAVPHRRPSLSHPLGPGRLPQDGCPLGRWRGGKGMLQIAPGEAVAVNSVLQLHHLLADPADQAPIDAVLECFASVQPKISLDAVSASGAGNAMAEAYLQREICDIVCGEGTARVERHEPLSRWRNRLGRARLSTVPLGSSALRQERMLVGWFSGEGHCVEEAEECLTLGWHGRPLFSARFGDLGEKKHCSSMRCGIHVSQNHFVLDHVSAISSKTTPIWAEGG